MSTNIRAYLGTAGLSDVGYQLYSRDTPAGARVTAGVLDEGGGFYSAANVTLAGDHVRWNSTGTASAKARVDISQMILLETLITEVAKCLKIGQSVRWTNIGNSSTHDDIALSAIP